MSRHAIYMNHKFIITYLRLCLSLCMRSNEIKQSSVICKKGRETNINAKNSAEKLLAAHIHTKIGNASCKSTTKCIRKKF